MLELINIKLGQFTCFLKVWQAPCITYADLANLAGYFSLNHTRMGPAQDLFGQLWKEYALSDSRYLTSDPFVLCMETVTAVCIQVLAINGTLANLSSLLGAHYASSLQLSLRLPILYVILYPSLSASAKSMVLSFTMLQACSITTISTSPTADQNFSTFGSTISS